MLNTLIASAALLATSALAQSVGSATVINKCSYDVMLQNTPSAGGGQSTVSHTLSPGGSYSQVYTELTNGNGWSLKLSKSASMGNIMQYEYTFHNDGTIWYDLSDVNGNPWNGNWEITATGDCSPRQAAYRYATDDAYGMQSCPDSSSITVTLCSGTSAGTGGSRAQPSLSPAEILPTTTWTSAETSTPTAAAPAVGKIVDHHAPVQVGKKIETHHHAAPSPTTFATISTPPASPASQVGYAATVTNVHTEWVTAYVTAVPAPAKRHVHHPRHAHQHIE